ncbi:MAG TPA: ATP-binding cassette domain-containing protein, partial [Leptospiraceae bacterium]|nr:ATP-binding cassette domain-containing protein [Leptospiraceae bacterium]
MLKVESLSRKFADKTAVNNISFTVKPGVITGLLGPNGAGKTTTMRLLTGYLEPTTGFISYKDRSLKGEELLNFKSKLGYLPESAPLYPDMLVSEYLEYMSDARNVPADKKQERIAEMTEICELATHISMPIGFLSKGFRQRVALAGTLIHDPEIIILDEPTSGLDPNQIAHIRNVIRNLGKEKTVILSTHILQEVEDICDEVIIISRGNIVANSTVKNLQSGFKVYFAAKAKESEIRSIFKAPEFTEIETLNEKSEDGYTPYLITITENRPENVFK